MSKESIDLDIDSSNELLFRVQIEGTDVSPARVRLVCECNDVSYVFKGYGTDEPGIVQFDIPNMSGRIKEGTYQSTVEVLIDNRYFAPVQFDINFKQPMKVSAESIVRRKKDDFSVSVTPIIVEKKNIVVEKQIEKKEVIVEKKDAIIEKKNEIINSELGLLASRRSKKISERTSDYQDKLRTMIEDFAKKALSE